MILHRVEHWDRALAEYIRETRGAKFRWDGCNCATWAAGAVEAMTGVDISLLHSGDVRSLRGALKACIRICGSPSFERLCELRAKTFEMAECRPIQARRGDLVLARADRIFEGRRFDMGVALGVVIGEQAAFFDADGDLRPMQTVDCKRAWRV